MEVSILQMNIILKIVNMVWRKVVYILISLLINSKDMKKIKTLTDFKNTEIVDGSLGF